MQHRSRFWFACVVMIVCHVLVRSSFAGPPATRPTDATWGIASRGLRASLEIQGRDTHEYHPGEPIQIYGLVQNTSDDSIRVQAIGQPSPYTILHVRIPDDRELVEAPLLGADDKAPWEKSLLSLQPGSKIEVASSSIRLGDETQGWVNAANRGLAIDLSFRHPGKYEFWYEYSVPSGGVNAWSGTLSSNHATIMVSDLPVEKRLQKPTAHQLEILKQFLGPKNAFSPRPGAKELEKAMTATENEGLALCIVELTGTKPAQYNDLLYLVQQRIGDPGPIGSGIDGPYLRRFAEQSVNTMERSNPPIDPSMTNGYAGGFDFHPGVAAVLSYLHFHPEDKKLKERAISLALRSAKMSLFPQGDADLVRGSKTRSVGSNGPLFIGFTMAWRILINTEVLHNGMSLGEAVEILGPPSADGGDWVTWIYVSPLRVNPRLRATLKEGKLSQFQE